MRGNIAFLAKFRRKLRTKNFEAHFNRKLRTIEKCSNVKKLRTAEPQPIFTGSYKKKECMTIGNITDRWIHRERPAYWAMEKQIPR